MKIRPVTAELFHADRQTSRHTTKLMVEFINFVNAAKTVLRPPKYIILRRDV